MPGPELTVGQVQYAEPGPFDQVKDYLSILGGGGLGSLRRAPKMAIAAPGAIRAARAKAQAETLRGGLPREDVLFGP